MSSYAVFGVGDWAESKLRSRNMSRDDCHANSAIIDYNSPMKMSPAFTRRDLASRVVIFLLALSSVIASLNAHWGLWGIDSSRAFPPWVRISVLLILSVGLFPPISFSISESLHRIFGSVPKRNYTAIYLAITGLALALFIGLSSRNSLLGDGFNILGNVAGGMTFSPTEPMEYAFHRLAYLSIGGKDPRLAFRISSYLAEFFFSGPSIILSRTSAEYSQPWPLRPILPRCSFSLGMWKTIPSPLSSSLCMPCLPMRIFKLKM